MNYLSRYQAVRPWLGGEVYGAPFILDRRREITYPRKGEEWWQSPEGQWIPVMRGGLGIRGALFATNPVYMGFRPGNNYGGSTTALSSAYTAGTAGAGKGACWLCPGGRTISNIYFYISSYTGTAASVTSINYEVRTGSQSAPTTTGGALLSTGSINPSSATGWLNFSGLSITPSAGSIWVIVEDADGNGTNFATVGSSFGESNQFPAMVFNSCDTTNGYSSGVSLGAGSPNLVVVFSSGQPPIGESLTINNGASGVADRRGIYLDGLLTSVRIWATCFRFGTNTCVGGEYYQGSPTPVGPSTASATTSRTVGGSSSSGTFWPTGLILQRNLAQRVVCIFNGSESTTIRKYSIGTGADDNLRAAMCVGGTGKWHWAESNGTTDWSNDDPNSSMDMYLLVDDLLTP